MKRALLAAVLAALATGAALATVGFGASSDSKSSRSSTGSGPPPTMKQAFAAGEKNRAARQAELADAIGVSTGKLQAALDELRRERLDADVAANRLTAAQRAAILACEDEPLTCDRSNLPAGHPRGHRGERPSKAGIAALLAKKLGVSEQKVKSALADAMPSRGGRDGGGRGPGMGGPGMGGPGMGGPGMHGPGKGGPGTGGPGMGMGGWR